MPQKSGGRPLLDINATIRVNFDERVDRISDLLRCVQREIEETNLLRAPHCWNDHDETGMRADPLQQTREVTSVVGYHDEIFGDEVGDQLSIVLPEFTYLSDMQCVMPALACAPCKPRRQAFIDQKP